MANVLLLNPFPAGFDSTQTTLTANGSIQLYGNAVATGEPIDWSKLIDGIGYNEVNFRGNGIHGQNTAQTTGFAVDTGIATVTAANNFFAGQLVTFAGNAGTLSALFNGLTVTILTATSSQFTFATALTGISTTGDVGIAYAGKTVIPPVPSFGATQNITVSALSASGTTLTVTGTNVLLPGALVNVQVATGSLGPKLANLQLPVLKSTGSAFTALMPSALTGSTGTGTATAINPPQPYSVKFWSELNSGYVYQYNSSTGCLFAMESAGFTPAGTNSAPAFTGESYTPAGSIGSGTLSIGSGTPATYPVGTAANTGATTLVATGAVTVPLPAGAFTGTAHTLAGTVAAPAFTGSAVAAGVLTALAAAAYPAGVLGDVIKFEAKFAKG